MTTRRILRALAWVPLFVGIAWMWPASLGGTVSFIQVSGGSMEPTMHTGDLALVREQDRYAVGDIVAFRIPKGNPAAGFLVIHRIIGGSAAEGYKLQGDNRDTPDLWRPTNADVVGERIALAPRVGSLLGRIVNPFGIATLLGLLTVLLVVTYNPTGRDERAPTPG